MRTRVAVLAAVAAGLLGAAALAWTALRGAPGGAAPATGPSGFSPRTAAQREAEDVVDAARRGRLSAALAGAASFLARNAPAVLAGDPDLRSSFEEARVAAGLWGLREAETLAAAGEAAGAAALLEKARRALAGTPSEGEVALAEARVREALALHRELEEEGRRREAEARRQKEVLEPLEKALAAARDRAQKGEDEEAMRDLAAALRAAKDPGARRRLEEELASLKRTIAETGDRRDLRRRADAAAARGEYARARELFAVLAERGPSGDPAEAAKDRDRLGGLKELEENREPEALAALRRGLRWLGRQQVSDGSFSIPLLRDPQGAVQNEDLAKAAQYRTGITGLAALALLGHVRYDITDEFEAPLKLSMNWISAAQKPDGSFGTKNLYENSICTLALIEADRLLHRVEVRPAAAKALQWLQDAQGPDGGWRYTPRPLVSDLSVTGWALQALLHARSGGYELRDRSVENAFSFVDGMTDYQTGEARYDPSKPVGPSMTAVALFCRLRNGMGSRDEVVKKAAAALLRNVPGAKGAKTDCYFLFYASDALSRLGGSSWARWAPGLKRALLPSQAAEGDAAGSWPVVEGDFRSLQAREAAPLYLAAMNCLSLENLFEHRER